MDIVWVNENADFIGGAEHYIAQTAIHLAERGVRSTLLYRAGTWVSPAYARAFDRVFPAVDVAGQLAHLRPDLIYAHQVRESALTQALACARVPVVRFFHDHALFCLRGHKYTAVGHRTCTRPIGMACYPCLGFVHKRRQGAMAGLGLRSLASLRAEQRLNQRFAGFVVASRYMAEHVIAHGFDRARVHQVPMYVPPVAINAEVRQADSLLFVGALVRGKGLDTLLSAMAKLPAHVALHIAGRGHQESRFREQARRLRLAPRVHFLGACSRERLAALYRRASCVVIPSREPETFAMVGPEALSAGAPVVATAVGGVGEWLLHQQTGLACRPGDADALASAITTVLADPAKAGEMAERGRQHCRERFTAEAHVSALMGVFRDVVGTSPGAGAHAATDSARYLHRGTGGRRL